jgi:hypothetical protein
MEIYKIKKIKNAKMKKKSMGRKCERKKERHKERRKRKKKYMEKKKERKIFCFQHNFSLLPFISSVTLS